jgi:hypothetical protein
MVYAPPRKSRPKPKPGRPASRPAPEPTRRRALELLASCGVEGCTQALMMAHGFSIEDMVELVRAELATVSAEHIVMDVLRLRITDKGWRASEAAVTHG